MSFFALLGSIVGPVANIIDDLHTSDEEKQKAATELARIDASLTTAQLEVNKAEAQHPSIFVAGWRPFVGWICALALAYQFLLYPLMTWGWKFTGIVGDPPDPLQSELLWTVITGMLGIGGMRSFDKFQGNDTKTTATR